MATASRGHGLIVRVQQLEAEFPSIERTLLSQTSHTSFLYNSGGILIINDSYSFAKLQYDIVYFIGL